MLKSNSYDICLGQDLVSSIHNVTLGLSKVQRNKVTTASISVVRLYVKAVTSCRYISLPSVDGFPNFVVSLIVRLTPSD